MSSETLKRLVAPFRTKRVYVTLELIGLAILLLALWWALRDVWAEAKPLLRHADLSDFAIGTAIVAAYYLVFVLGWMRILVAYGIRVPYRVALQSEMLSMLAKYIPGGVWTPTARVVALRRFGVKDTPVVLASILLEAGISAVAGVIVFVVGLVIIGGADVPLLPVAAFAVVVAFLLYPPVFGVGREPAAASVRCGRGGTASRANGVRAARLLRAHLAARRRRSLLHAALGGRRPGGLHDPVPRRRRRRRCDRRRARGLRPLGARRSRSVDVRAAARGRNRIGRARGHDPEPARDHARRGLARARGLPAARGQGNRSLSGARSRAPPLRHSRGTRYSGADAA